MFTGIVEEVGTVRELRSGTLKVVARVVLDGTRLGDSIDVNGACLTVTDLGSDCFAVGLSPETLRRTNLGRLRPGDGVNLERAVAVGGRFGGHYVQGHVDGVGEIASVSREGNSTIMRIAVPPDLLLYVVEKGFIAVDGISLTVVAVNSTGFTISLIPFTQSAVTLPKKGPGAQVNVEVDILGKYVEKILLAREGKTSRITAEFLADHGFGR